MFTKLAPHEDVGENVTFMARFIILPTQCRHAVEGSAAAAAHRGSSMYAKILHACVFFCSSIAAPRALQDYSSAKMRNVIVIVNERLLSYYVKHWLCEKKKI